MVTSPVLISTESAVTVSENATVPRADRDVADAYVPSATRLMAVPVTISLVSRLPRPVSSESAVKRTSPAISSVEPIARSMSPATTPGRCEPNRPKRGQVPVRIGVGGEGAVEKHLGALGDGDVAAAVERAVAVDECAGRSNRLRCRSSGEHARRGQDEVGVVGPPKAGCRVNESLIDRELVAALDEQSELGRAGRPDRRRARTEHLPAAPVVRAVLRSSHRRHPRRLRSG